MIKLLRIKTLSISGAAILLCHSALAQDPDFGMSPVPTPAESATYQTALNYVFSIPFGDLHDYIPNVSYRGIEFEGLYRFPRKPYGLGVSIRWVYFHQLQENETKTVGNATITGRFEKSVDSFPITVPLRYYFKEFEGVSPYVSLGVGAIYVQRESSVGALTDTNYGWQFVLAPEAGVLYFPKPGGVGGHFKVRYDGGFGTDDMQAITDLNFAIGVAWAY